jgi:sugar phosphate isomerase/epimerase
VHRLSDALRLAELAGIGVGMDIFACWVDADIEEAISAAAARCAFVQISDYVPGDRGLPCRAVPGDGAVPLARLLNLTLASGYKGNFDIEVIGPRLAPEGYESGLRRALSNVRALLGNGS